MKGRLGVWLLAEEDPPLFFLVPNMGLEEFKIKTATGRVSGQNLDWMFLENGIVVGNHLLLSSGEGRRGVVSLCV